jgi:hypothetical protein
MSSRSRPGSLGMLMPISSLAGAGVFVIALADTAAREGKATKEGLLWAGILLIVLPVAARLCAAAPTRRERIWLALVFGLSLYLAKVTYSPTRLAFSDEFVHLRSVKDDLSSGHLFSFNPLLPEAARYPGLGAVTSGLVRLSGLPISTAALVEIGCARGIMMLAIFLVVERLARSPRVAGLACFFYAANPNFLYWSSQFSYESLALPLVAFTFFLVLRRSSDGATWRVPALAAASILAVVITHHLSSYFLAAVLLGWSAVVLWRRWRLGTRGEYLPLGLAVLALVAIGVWLLAVAPITSQYLGSIASSTGEGLFNVLTGAGVTRKLFTSGAEVAPIWERVLSIASVALTLLAIVFAAILIWKRRRVTPLMLAPLLLALAYPLLLPLRFIASAAETANRSSEFLFLGVGAVLSAAAVALRARGASRIGRLSAGGVVCFSVIVLLGGLAVSWQYSERLPQDEATATVPYQLGATAISADQWAAASLGPGHRFASDFLDHLGLATYGRQRTLWAPVDRVSAWQIMAPASVDPAVRRAIRQGGIEYVLIERRLSDGIPAVGYYFDKGEPGAGDFTRPLEAGTLAKFDRVSGVSRLYDNDREQIYAVTALR